jgi:hypothetical protein
MPRDLVLRTGGEFRHEFAFGGKFQDRSDALIGGPRAPSDIRSSGTPVPLEGSAGPEKVLASPAEHHAET